MSILLKLMSAIRGGRKPLTADAPADAAEPAYAIPTVKFDPEQVTEEIKADFEKNVRNIKDFDEANFDRIYDAGLRSISNGRDTAILFNAIMELDLPGMTRRRAGEISLSLNNKATALMDRNRQMASGIKYAVWIYSGAPCQTDPKNPWAKDIRQDAAHKAANGKRYEIAKGMVLNGRRTMPGWDEGCKCVSGPVVKGFS